MNYDGDIIRPPSEANSIIIQVTVGCSHNKCTFCGAYKDGTKKFRIRNDREIRENILLAAKYGSRQKRIFLADGDALILSQKRLIRIFSLLREHLPQARRIALYGNGKAIRSKSLAELTELKQLGLHRIYMGMESGDNQTLQDIRKGESADSLIRAAHLARDADIFLSVTVLLGVAGRTNSLLHARKTGEIVSKMMPRQIAALCLMPLANTPLGIQYNSGEFQLPDATGMLLELKELIKSINCKQVQFNANHASNYLPISGILTRDRDRLLNKIDQALLGTQPLVPDYYRAL